MDPVLLPIFLLFSFPALDLFLVDIFMLYDIEAAWRVLELYGIIQHQGRPVASVVRHCAIEQEDNILK